MMKSQAKKSHTVLHKAHCHRFFSLFLSQSFCFHDFEYYLLLCCRKLKFFVLASSGHE